MKIIRPEKTSNRTKEQIVVEKELELYSHIIDGTNVCIGECGLERRCYSRFQQRLDKAVLASEEALREDN